MPEFNGARSPNVDRPLVQLADRGPSDNVRSNGEDGLVLRMILRSLPKEVSQDWNLRQPRNAAQRLGLGVVKDSANQARLPVSQTDFMLDLFLPDDGLADAADARLTHY